jgi:hypothetical protein
MLYASNVGHWKKKSMLRTEQSLSAEFEGCVIHQVELGAWVHYVVVSAHQILLEVERLRTC